MGICLWMKLSETAQRPPDRESTEVLSEKQSMTRPFDGS